jgi:AcrR family transcriptional regulator
LKKSEEMKERIIRATMELIEQGNGRAEEITTRMIADKTGIGVGLIHYHFQTKERLLELCVQRMIGGVIAGFRPSASGTLTGTEALKSVAKEVADFLMDHPSISRISILGDLAAPQADDNTAKTMRGFAMAYNGGRLADGGMEEIAREDLEASQVSSQVPQAPLAPQAPLQARLFTLTAMLQVAFLRQDISSEGFGWDVRIKEERGRYIDWLIDQLFAKEERR